MSARATLSLEGLAGLLRLHECRVEIIGLAYDEETRTVRLDLSGDGIDRLADPQGEVAFRLQYQNPQLSSNLKLVVENKS